MHPCRLRSRRRPSYMVKKTNDAYLNIQETIKPNRREKNVCASALRLKKRRVVTRELIELTPPPPRPPPPQTACWCGDAVHQDGATRLCGQQGAAVELLKSNSINQQDVLICGRSEGKEIH